MSPTILFFLAFITTLSVVNCRDRIPSMPPHVNTINAQCRARGFRGACANYNVYENELECDSIVCARRTRNGRYKARFSRAAADGTRCAWITNKMCIAGICTAVPRDRIPVQVGAAPSITCDK